MGGKGIRVGFIGLSRMGKPMANNILKAGYPLAVHSRSLGPVEELKGLGATAAGGPQAVTRASDVVLTCLPGPADVEQALLGPRGAVAAARPGCLFIDHSTVDPETSRRVAREAESRQAVFLDAPVSGGVSGAEETDLIIMVGGPREAFEHCLPVLKCVGRRFYHLGPAGSGNMAKLCNQVTIGVAYAAVAEAMVLGVKAGLDPEALFEILSVSSARSRSLEQAGPMILDGRFETTFS
ncbi:MAG: NAD(P)-dependent oxidoreductase [Planctomycetes bacterium]|nr:NAD(P)-dependent oxidoreductase [Planctomycetota bacterium]